jgi:hypothetical protein
VALFNQTAVVSVDLNCINSLKVLD